MSFLLISHRLCSVKKRAKWGEEMKPRQFPYSGDDEALMQG